MPPGKKAMERQLCQSYLEEGVVWTLCKLLETVMEVRASAKVNFFGLAALQYLG